MNIKKSIVAIATSLITIASLGSLAASAYSTISYVPYTTTADVTTYNGKYTGSYASFYALVGATSVSSSAPGYLNAYKYAYYAQYRDDSGYPVLDASGSDYGPKQTAYAGQFTVSSAIVKRYHTGYIRYSSDSSSSIRESYDVTVNKP